MIRLKSKFLVVIVLAALCGQLAASPLLMCSELSASDMNTDGYSLISESFDHNQDQHAGSHSANHSQGNGDSDHNCELCVSCSSASATDKLSFSPSPATLLVSTSYSNPPSSSLLENPFRPPIAH